MVLKKLSSYIYYSVVFCHEFEDEEAVMTCFDHNFDSGRRDWGGTSILFLVNHVIDILPGDMHMLC